MSDDDEEQIISSAYGSDRIAGYAAGSSMSDDDDASRAQGTREEPGKSASTENSGDGGERKEVDEDIWEQARNSRRKALESSYDDRRDEDERADPDKRFFELEKDILEAVKKEDSEFPNEEDLADPAIEEFRKVELPLADQLGRGGVEDFITAMEEHPTDYARLTRLVVHPNSKREPRPLFAKSNKHIQQPSHLFVDSHKRFLFVTGLPPLTVNEDVGDIGNPIHRSAREKMVAKLVRVESTQVSVANTTSAFVGFKTPRQLANILKEGPEDRRLTLLPVVERFDPDSFATMNESLTVFVESATSTDCILRLTNLPIGNTNASLAKSLVPVNSKLYTIYGQLSSRDIYFLSRNSALVRLSSVEKAESIVQSALFQARLKEIGTYTVRFLRARRELRHKCFHPYDKTSEIRVNGPRLMVDGIHMPPKEFYISHASMMKLRKLDPDVMSKEYLTNFFQKFSQRRRCLSSIEFVTCELSGEPILGMAYVGFEEPNEASACINSCSAGKIKIGEQVAQLQLVQDRQIPHTNTDPETRSVRDVADLEDEMTNWQKYVDPADIEYLDQNGAPRVILDEIFRGIRKNNTYFGAFDGNFRDEKIEPDKGPKQLYREIVQLYVETLKECVCTPEDPGEMYINQFRVGEEIDLSIFDNWKKRKAEIDASRTKYYL